MMGARGSASRPVTVNRTGFGGVGLLDSHAAGELACRASNAIGVSMPTPGERR